MKSIVVGVRGARAARGMGFAGLCGGALVALLAGACGGADDPNLGPTSGSSAGTAGADGSGGDGAPPTTTSGGGGDDAGGSGTTNPSTGVNGATGSGGGGGGAGTGGAGTGGDGTAGWAPASVEWFTWPAQQDRTSPTWGSALNDIASHLPSSYGSTYDDPDTVTFGHETSHGIHAHLRVYVYEGDDRVNAFYVLGDQAAFVREPAIWKHDVAAYVPPSLRGSRFDLYVTGQEAWDDTPLYLFDEWNAYANGAEVGVARVHEGLWNEGWRGQDGNFEFVPYALAVGLAVKELDPDYFESYPQFREFLKWNVERSMALYAEYSLMPEFEYEVDTQAVETFRTSEDAGDLRQFAKDLYGEAWSAGVLGI